MGGEAINSGSPISPHFQICTQQDPTGMTFSSGTSGLWRKEGGREKVGAATVRNRAEETYLELGSPKRVQRVHSAWIREEEEDRHKAR